MFHAMFVLVSPGLDGCTICFMIYVCIDTDQENQTLLSESRIGAGAQKSCFQYNILCFPSFTSDFPPNAPYCDVNNVKTLSISAPRAQAALLRHRLHLLVTSERVL